MFSVLIVAVKVQVSPQVQDKISSWSFTSVWVLFKTMIFCYDGIYQAVGWHFLPSFHIKLKPQCSIDFPRTVVAPSNLKVSPGEYIYYVFSFLIISILIFQLAFWRTVHSWPDSRASHHPEDQESEQESLSQCGRSETRGHVEDVGERPQLSPGSPGAGRQSPGHTETLLRLFSAG